MLNRATYGSCGFESHAFRLAGPMVKRRSSLVSTEAFRVRVLVGLLEDRRTEGQTDKRKGHPMGDGVRLEAG